jgi:hypothetical protein
MRGSNKLVMSVLGLFAVLCMSSCVSIAEYQKMYLNDQDMQLIDDQLAAFESNFHTYREGASGANGGKSGGGCGCN